MLGITLGTSREANLLRFLLKEDLLSTASCRVIIAKSYDCVLPFAVMYKP